MGSSSTVTLRSARPPLVGSTPTIGCSSYGTCGRRHHQHSVKVLALPLLADRQTAVTVMMRVAVRYRSVTQHPLCATRGPRWSGSSRTSFDSYVRSARPPSVGSSAAASTVDALGAALSSAQVRRYTLYSCVLCARHGPRRWAQDRPRTRRAGVALTSSRAYLGRQPQALRTSSASVRKVVPGQLQSQRLA
eukprot:5407111-Heterocapsa_arctica.AAC.1